MSIQLHCFELFYFLQSTIYIIILQPPEIIYSIQDDVNII